MSNINLVIFDCDGVLVDSEMISAEIIADVLRPVGIHMTVEEAYKTFVGGSMGKTISYVEERLGYKPDYDIEQSYRRLSFEAYRKRMRPVDGIIDVLNNLKVPKCVASNGPRAKIDLNLQLTGLDKFFRNEKIFSAYDIQKWKPDPALYLKAANEYDVRPNECLVIEDSIHGLQAAAAAGMKSFGLSYPLKPLPNDIIGAEIHIDMYSIGNRLMDLNLIGGNKSSLL